MYGGGGRAAHEREPCHGTDEGHEPRALGGRHDLGDVGVGHARRAAEEAEEGTRLSAQRVSSRRAVREQSARSA
eukprot:4984045-Pleurochrysis_carterae.AAC.1